MSKWMMIMGLGFGVAALAVGIGLQQVTADDHEQDEAAQEAPVREVDLAVISDPSHEKMTQTAPDTYEVLFHTTAGDFTVAVTRAWAPNGADRFYNLVTNGYFDGNRFFRVVPDFVVQWGIHGNKDVNKAWYDRDNAEAVNLQDDPVKQSNIRGRLTFANAGPNTRSTQLFINLGSNTFLDDPAKMRGAVFAPFAQVQGEGMDIVDKLFGGYGEPPPNLQGAIVQEGNAILDEYFPKLDGIITATIVADPEAEAGEEDAGE